MIPVSEYVVVHDYHMENEDAIGPLFENIKASYKVCRRYEPPTLVASASKKVPDWI